MSPFPASGASNYQLFSFSLFLSSSSQCSCGQPSLFRLCHCLPGPQIPAFYLLVPMPGWLTLIFWALHNFLFSFSISEANMLLMTTVGSYEPSTVLCTWHILSPLTQYISSYVLLSWFLKWGNVMHLFFEIQKKKKSAGHVANQVSDRSALKSRTKYWQVCMRELSLF